MTSINRRSLLSLVGSATVSLGTIPLVTAEGSNPSEKNKTGAVGHDPQLIPMNAANLTPMFSRVEQAFDEYQEILRKDVSFITRGAFVANKVESARQKVATMLSVDTKTVAFVRNTSEANSILINGIDLSDNDEILVWSENHATNRVTWHYRAQTQPIIVRDVTLPDQSMSNAEIAQLFSDAISDRTKVVALSHISNVSGRRMPVKDIVEQIKAKNPSIHIHIDGAQSWGSVDVNLTDLGCDSYSASAHKWLLGPRGAGIFYVKDEAIKTIRPTTLGYNLYFTYPEKEIPSTAERFECHGQRDLSAFAAIGDTIDEQMALGGPEVVEAEIKNIVDFARRALIEKQIQVTSPARDNQNHGVIVMDLRHRARAMAGFLMLHQANIAAAFVDAPPSIAGANDQVYLRISPHLYNTTEQVAIAANIIQSAQNLTTDDAVALVRQYL